MASAGAVAGVALAGPGSTTFDIGRVSSWIAQSFATCALAPAATITTAAAPMNRRMPVSLFLSQGGHSHAARWVFATPPETPLARRRRCAAPPCSAVGSARALCHRRCRLETMSGNGAIKVGLVQMSMSADPDENLKKAVARVADARGRARRSSACPSSSARPTSARRRTRRSSTSRSRCPGPSTEALGAARARTPAWWWWRRSSSGARPASTTTARPSSTPRGRWSGLYRKMHIPDDPLFYEKFYFTPGDLGFRPSTPGAGRIGTLICWDQWYPGGRAPHRAAGRGRPLLSRPPSAGIPTRRTQYGAAQRSTPGRPSSARTPSRTASTWRW